jgi:hypothetical protein
MSWIPGFSLPYPNADDGDDGGGEPGAVSSVNGYTGDVNLDAVDVGAETAAGAQAKADAKVAQTVTNGVTTSAPSQDVVFDQLALKANASNAVFTGTVTIPDSALAIADTSGLQAALDAKASSANPTFTGTVTIPDNALAIADTSGLQTALNAKAPLASPTFTGTPIVPTAAPGTDTTQAASTAYVKAEIESETVEIGGIPAADALDGAELALLEQDGNAVQRSYTNILADFGVIRNTGAQSIAGVKAFSDALVADADIFGGDGASEGLTIGSTTHATRGLISLRDHVLLITEDKTYTSTTAPTLLEVSSSRTFTLNDTAGGINAGNALSLITYAPTIVFDADANLLTSGNVYSATQIVKNVNGETRSIAGGTTLNSNPTFRADGATVTFGSSVSTYDHPVWERINSGTNNATAHTSLLSDAVVSAGSTLTTRNGTKFNDATGAGTLTTQIGVDIADTITIQDQGTLGSSNLRLMTTTVALSPRDSVTLVYSSTVGDWVQIAPIATVI